MLLLGASLTSITAVVRMGGRALRSRMGREEEGRREGEEVPRGQLGA